MDVIYRPEIEKARLQALQEYSILDTPPEPTFDAVTQLAVSLLRVPIAIITLVDSDRQWFKSAQGLGDLKETSRDMAFCSHTILEDGMLLVPDTNLDNRFKENPLVCGDPNIRFYAGVPLIDSDGHALGSLCVIDRQPRVLTEADEQNLADLANVAIALLENHKTIVKQENALKTIIKKQSDLASIAGDYFWETDALCRFTWISKAPSENVPESLVDKLGKNRNDLMLPGMSKSMREDYLQCLKNRRHFENIEYSVNVDHNPLWFKTSGLPVHTDCGEFLGYRGTCTEITESKLLKERLHREKETAQVTLESINDAVITTDTNAVVTYLNPAAEKITGWSSAQACGNRIGEILAIFDEQKMQSADNPVEYCLSNNQAIRSVRSAVLIDRQKNETAIEYSAAPIRNRQGNIIGAVFVFSDATDSRRVQQKLSYLATHDQLTGLVNRHEFERKVSRSLESCDHANEGIILFYLDLDQFKIINDTCGHTAGDEVLRQVAHLIQKKIRSSDCLARIGGDEFGVLLCCCPLEVALKIAESIRNEIDNYRFFWGESSYAIGVSIGVVSSFSSDTSLGQLMQSADQACYIAKQEGRNRIQLYEEKNEKLHTHRVYVQNTTLIQQGIDENRFELFYQPIVQLQNDLTDKQFRYELLIRLRLPEGKVLSPGAFLPAAERFNMMTQIDQWVVDTTLLWLSEHTQHCQALNWCTINLSGQSFGDKYFQSYLLDALVNSKVSSDKICFEITETAAMSQFSDAVKFMGKMKDLGCFFALDDFGSGLSSFRYLKNMPVDFVKIDGLFSRNINRSSIDLEMMKSINNIAHLMGKETIAEFVENSETAKSLKRIGIDYAQGYHFCQPAPLRIEAFDSQREKLPGVVA